MSLLSTPTPIDVSSDRYAVLGKIAWLWMNSPLHRHWPVELLARFALPPVKLGQYELLERDGLPVAYCSWAHMNGRAEAAYLTDPSKLDLTEWQSGEHLWFIDWVAPFAVRDSWHMKCLLADRFPLSVARAIRVKAETSKGRVMEFKGRLLDPDVARRTLDRFAAEFLKNLTAK